VTIRRPRVRDAKGEVTLPTFVQIAAKDPLTARALEQMLVGVATRRYARSLEPIGRARRGTSKSAVSRRFVAATQAQLEAWRTRSLRDLPLLALYLDGVHFGRHCLVIALGVDTQGQKHVLGVWAGSTENATVCRDLLTNLQDRGLPTDRSLLVIVDGSKALAKAITEVFGAAAWLQRCQVHKTRNILDYVPKADRPIVHAALRRAYQQPDPVAAKRLLLDLARRLDASAPAAAASLREGLDETLTILALPGPARLHRSLASTNVIESLMSRLRATHRHVTRWRHEAMAVRWAAAGIREATRGFHRLFGARDLRPLLRVLAARDQRLGLNIVSRVAA
jgi:transposase-like protein